MPNDAALAASDSRPHDALFPLALRTPEETGVPFLFLVELISKVLYLRGQMQLSELTGHVKLSVGVVDKILTFLRAEKLCDSTRRGNSGTDADLCVALTDLGRARRRLPAAECLRRSGPRHARRLHGASDAPERG
ncbi:hypothetical protein LP420_31100 [Massilia sp. B-10]|nr:hypothetical protein LP420_31100 [Massilia sp. B-10]